MNPRSLFIFSSEMVSKTASMAALLLWTALWLACVDLALNLTFAYLNRTGIAGGSNS